MKLFTRFLLVLFMLICATETYSNENTKKKNSNHSLGFGLGIASLRTPEWEDHNPGRSFNGTYTNNKKHVIQSVRVSYTKFSELKVPSSDFQSSVYDIGLKGGIYWNILQRDFYEGVTPFAGLQYGLTFIILDQTINDNSNSGYSSLICIAPTAGVIVPLAPTVALEIMGEYNLNFQGKDGIVGSTIYGGITDYFYYVLSAGVKFNI